MTHFVEPVWLAALLAVAWLVVLVWRALGRRDRAAAAIGAVSSRHRWHATSAAAVLGALALAVVALARPSWGAPVEAVRTRGADVVVAIDLSLSMLARDAKPSRIERAKLLLRDLVDRLDGDRIGLIGFAGSSGVLIPLTPDTEAARMFADELQVQSVDEPGTVLARPVRQAVEMFDAAGQGERVLVVLSDGEDLSPDPTASAEETAAVARDAGVRVVAVAIGSEEGAEIPLDVMGSGAVKRDAEGRPVITRARRDVLGTLAGDGLFLDATRGDEAAEIARFVGESEAGWALDAARRSKPERYQIPLLVALLLLVADYAASAWRR